MTGPSPSAGSTEERSGSGGSAPAGPPVHASYLRIAILPLAVIGWLCVVAALVALFAHATPQVDRLALAGVAGGVLLMLVVAVVGAWAASRQIEARVRAIRLVSRRGQAELQQLADKVMRGEQLPPLVPVPARAAAGDPFRRLENELEQSHYEAGRTVLRVAEKVRGGRSDQRVEIFVNLARRMQSLVHREIELLDDLEAQVEDPELLKGLFTVDHLATRMRRQAESLAVLGGSASRRQWTRQVTMHEVLRAAAAEVEQYSRVKVVPPVEGVLRGAAVTDVIHLIAELVENATRFSAPETSVLLRAQPVSAGLAIEIEDRGLGILPTDQQRMNDLLADPGRMNIDELLYDGRIGLYVVAALARRHGIRVRLQSSIYGGTAAMLVLPAQLLEQSDADRALAHGDFGEDDASAPRLAPVPPGGGSAGAGAGAGAVTGAGTGPLSTRRPSSGVPEVAEAYAASAESWGSGAPATDAAERPPLPSRRQAQALDANSVDNHRDEPGGAKATRATEPAADQMTGLMADFLTGVGRAGEEDSPARD